MRDSIYTIPVNEVFEPRCGCPICAMERTLEQRCVEYIMGAAMMEPDVRIETNRLGFCVKHFDQMLHQKNRLSLALMLESQLKEISAADFKDIKARAEAKPKKRESVSTINHTCFVCEKIEWGLSRMLVTVADQYAKDPEFQKLFAEQEFLCLPHLERVLCAGADHLPKKLWPRFREAAVELARKPLREVGEDVSHFCKMFDYRNAGEGADWGNSRDSIERAIRLLTGVDFRE
ncbi:MAG TPA: hypothetical protein IAB22_06670 [Candidatus Merdivicinus intestinavium]|nr:hypothetical protein [Candidatus Merdivicinus intestinavium]